MSNENSYQVQVQTYACTCMRQHWVQVDQCYMYLLLPPKRGLLKHYTALFKIFFGCWLLAKTAYMIADFGHGPCGHYADGVA